MYESIEKNNRRNSCCIQCGQDSEKQKSIKLGMNYLLRVGSIKGTDTIIGANNNRLPILGKERNHDYFGTTSTTRF